MILTAFWRVLRVDLVLEFSLFSFPFSSPRTSFTLLGPARVCPIRLAMEVTVMPDS